MKGLKLFELIRETSLIQISSSSSSSSAQHSDLVNSCVMWIDPCSVTWMLSRVYWGSVSRMDGWPNAHLRCHISIDNFPKGQHLISSLNLTLLSTNYNVFWWSTDHERYPTQHRLYLCCSFLLILSWSLFIMLHMKFNFSFSRAFTLSRTLTNYKHFRLCKIPHARDTESLDRG